MAETSCLLNNRTGKPVPAVRIRLSPPNKKGLFESFFYLWIDGRFKPQRRGSKIIAGCYYLATKGRPKGRGQEPETIRLSPPIKLLTAA